MTSKKEETKSSAMLLQCAPLGYRSPRTTILAQFCDSSTLSCSLSQSVYLHQRYQTTVVSAALLYMSHSLHPHDCPSLPIARIMALKAHSGHNGFRKFEIRYKRLSFSRLTRVTDVLLLPGHVQFLQDVKSGHGRLREISKLIKMSSFHFASTFHVVIIVWRR